MALLYKVIAEQILSYIYDNKALSKLPTERELSIRFNVSRQTIRKALKICEESGIIERRQGSGIYLSASYLLSINHVALFIPSKEEYIYPKIISELEKRYKNISYTLDIYETHDSLSGERESLNSLIDNPVSTLLVIQNRNMLPSPFADKYRQLSQNGTNIIFIGNPCPNLSDYTYIKFDDFFSGYSVASKIADKDNNFCAVFVSDNRGSTDRYYGFIQCMEDMDHQYNESNIHWITYDDLLNIRVNNTESIKSILAKYSELPSIFICGQDEIAYSIIMQLKNRKQLSDDISFYSFDNSYLQTLIYTKINSFNGDKSMLYSKIIECTMSGNKKKEVFTLPSSLNG